MYAVFALFHCLPKDDLYDKMTVVIDKPGICHSERSEESHRNKRQANRRDSSLRSERSYDNQSMCLFRLRNK